MTDTGALGIGQTKVNNIYVLRVHNYMSLKIYQNIDTIGVNIRSSF